jgi:tetratricopeptide (TPR) repeat protein
VNRRPVSLVGRALLAALCAALVAACGSSTPARAPNTAHEAALASSQRAARALQRGDAAAALALYEQALSAADSVEDFDTSGATLLNLSLVHARLGQVREAHQRVDRILQAQGRYTGALQSQAATRKALLYLDAPDLQSALTWVDRAQAACTEPCALAAVLADIRAHVALERGDAAGAAAQATRAAALAVAPEQQAEQANAQRLLGRAQAKLGDRNAAAAALRRALDIDRSLGLPDRIALDLLYAGDNAAQGGQAAEAREFFERALRVSEAAGLSRTVDVVKARLKSLDPSASRTP